MRSVFLFSLLLLLLFLSFTAYAQIRVGVVYSPGNPKLAATYVLGQKLYPAMVQRVQALFQQQILTNPVFTDTASGSLVDIRNVSFQFSAAKSLTTAAVYAATVALLNQTKDQRPHFLVCPVGGLDAACAQANEFPASPLDNPLGPIPALSPGDPTESTFRCISDPLTKSLPAECKAPNTRRFQYLFGLSSGGYSYFQGALDLIAVQGGSESKNFLIITEDAFGFYEDIAFGVLDYIERQRLGRVDVFRFPSKRTSTTPDLVKQAVDFIHSQPRDYDAVFVAVTGCDETAQGFYQQGYTPKAGVMMQCFTAGIEQTDANALRYWQYPVQWSPFNQGVDYAETLANTAVPIFLESSAATVNYNSFINPSGPSATATGYATDVLNDSAASASRSSAMQFDDLVFNLTGNHATYLEGLTGSPLSTIFNALRVCNTLDAFYLKLCIQVLTQSSYYGKISFDSYGVNRVRQMTQIQINHDVSDVIIGPPSSATAKLVYPMPTFTERVADHTLYKTAEEKTVIAFFAVFTVSTLILSLSVVRYRNHPALKAAGWLFCTIMAMGCMVAYGAIWTWSLENNDSTCAWRIWVITLGFHLYFSPMIAKNARVAFIFNQKRFKIVSLEDWKLLGVAFLFTIPQLLINLFWSTLDPLTPSLNTPDPLRPVYDYYECNGNHTLGFVISTLVYSAFLMLSVCYIGYLNRKVEKQFVEDSASLAYCTYLFLFVAVVIVSIQAALSGNAGNRSALYVLRSIGWMLMFQIPVAVFLVPRVRRAYTYTKEEMEKILSDERRAVEQAGDSSTLEKGAVKRLTGRRGGGGGGGNGSGRPQRLSSTAGISGGGGGSGRLQVTPPAQRKTVLDDIRYSPRPGEGDSHDSSDEEIRNRVMVIATEGQSAEMKEVALNTSGDSRKKQSAVNFI